MRNAYAALALVLLFYAPQAGMAQPEARLPAAPDPGQWTMGADGVKHEASDTNCLTDVPGFAPLSFARPSPGAGGSNLLGTCLYVDVTGRGDGAVRVRRYARGEGESREAIANDRDLMEPGPQGAPLFTARMTAATTPDGMMGGRITITKEKNGYLIDCYAEGATLEIASAKVASICGK